MPAVTMSDQVASLARKVAQDQIAQDIDNNSKFAAKADVPATEMLQQLIAFYNGYSGATLDYRSFLGQSAQAVLDAFYEFGRGYEGGS